MQSKAILILSAICVALLTGGCAGFQQANPDADLDAAYQNGNLTAAQYYQLKMEREAQREAYNQQNEAAQRQRQEDIQNSFQQTQAELDRNTAQMSDFLIRNTPTIQPHSSTEFPNLQPNQKLPSAIDMPSSSDMQTGRTQMGPDGRLWYEYRTSTGYAYWRAAQ